MGTISYTVPVAGSDLNSVAAPELATALTTLLTWANGNVDGSNLDLAALSTTNGLTRLATRTVTESVTAAASDLIVTSSSGVIVTLPSATVNAVVGVVASSGGAMTGAAPVEITGSNIFCQGASAASTVKLGTPGSYLVLQCDGTNWFAISGQQDTGWVALSLGSGVSAGSGYYTPAARLQGDRVALRGELTGSAITAWATIPSGLHPASNVGMGPYFGVQAIEVTSAGALVTTSGGTVLGLDNMSYSLS